MFMFVLRKMLSNKWMILSLLIGNLLLCAMVASIPMYSDAILQRMLMKQLEQQQADTNRFPFTAEIKFSSSSVRRGYELQTLEWFEQSVDEMSAAFGLPVLEKVTMYATLSLRTDPVVDRETHINNRQLKLEFMSGIENHIELTSGRMYSPALDEDGAIEIIVNERTLIERDLLLGELLVMKNITYADGSPVLIKAVGTYKNSDENDLYWLYAPSTFYDTAIADEGLFREMFITNYKDGANFTAAWYVMYDYNAILQTDVPRLLAATEAYRNDFGRFGGTSAYRFSFSSTLDAFVSESEHLGVTLWVLQVPIFVLLAFFIFMVSKQILEQEKNTIAVVKSRGASRAQVIRIFLAQSTLLSGISLLLGVPLGALICRLLGASNGFLGLVRRSALAVRLVPESIWFALVAAAVSVLTMVIPVFAYSGVTIVDHKRTTGKRKHSPLWQNMFLDVLLLGVSLYGLYTFNNQKAALAAGLVTAPDPLLFVSSSLFIIGAGLLFLRLYPLLIRLVFSVFKRFWPPALYASFLKVTRSMHEAQFIMLFLVLTMATGVFNAKAARTINLNMEHNIRYQYGADIVMAEPWRDNGSNEEGNVVKATVYYEPDFEKYSALRTGNTRLTKVQNTTSGVVADSIRNNVRLMGINTKEFGEIAWFRDDILPAHWYDYLNAMTTDSRAVLVSMNFHTLHGYKPGDSIGLTNSGGMYFSGKICGFVDHWPTYDAVTVSYDRNGNRTERDNYLIVANLAQVQSAWGVMPYQIWMQTDDPAAVYTLAAETGLRFSTFRDAQAEIIKQKNNPVLQGTNGVLTVGFIIILAVCMTGFLIYWILSIRSRTLQFGIFRAMGMSMKSVLVMLANEQLFISVTSIAAGAGIGLLASDFFVPLIQLGYTAGTGSTPLIVVAESGDYVRLFTTVGVMLVACTIVLGLQIASIKIAQALKLGED